MGGVPASSSAQSASPAVLRTCSSGSRSASCSRVAVWGAATDPSAPSAAAAALRIGADLSTNPWARRAALCTPSSPMPSAVRVKDDCSARVCALGVSLSWPASADVVAWMADRRLDGSACHPLRRRASQRGGVAKTGAPASSQPAVVRRPSLECPFSGLPMPEGTLRRLSGRGAGNLGERRGGACGTASTGCWTLGISWRRCAPQSRVASRGDVAREDRPSHPRWNGCWLLAGSSAACPRGVAASMPLESSFPDVCPCP